MPDQKHRSQGTQPPPSQKPPVPAPRDERSLPQQQQQHEAFRARFRAAGGAPVLPLHAESPSGAHGGLVRNPRRTAPTSAAAAGASGQDQPKAIKPRRISSDDSGETEHSDPSKWFDQSNKNPGQSFGHRGMDVDTPYFQKESDSSNGEIPKDASGHFPFPPHIPQHPGVQAAATTSSAEDYRSVIDDLTIEIKRLKEELRRYKQNVPENLRKDALFEVRVHRLTKRRKRELENTLRDFATSLSGSSRTTTSGRPITSSECAAGTMGSSAGASKSKLSNKIARPVDSAYASMSNAGTSIPPNPTSSSSLLLGGKPGLSGKQRSAQQKVQSYLEGVPEGLYPRHMVMAEKDKQKLVVRRLEKIFTGNMGGRHKQTSDGRRGPPALLTEPSQSQSNMSPPANPPAVMPVPDAAAREARMLTADAISHRKGHSRGDNGGSASGSAEDQTESGGLPSGSGNGSGRSSRRGAQSSPAERPAKHEQRPTRPLDLDPDRIPPPSENMDYIRHLGLAPPSNLSDTVFSSEDVAPDADGWVWLNLLCNLAQLHMLNVTPGFIRKAVAQKSRKFQISPDGQKIRWRGGTEGTRFSSDSSGGNSRRSRSTDEEASAESASGGQRKKVKTQHPMDSVISGSSDSRNNRRSSSSAFHYKPMFRRQPSSPEQTSDEAGSLGSLGRGVDSNGNSNDSSGLGLSSGSGRRRVEGSIVYYSGAPFCTDLSRDPPIDLGCTSSPDESPEASPPSQPVMGRTVSGSTLSSRPLSQPYLHVPPLESPDLLDVDDEEEFVAPDSPPSYPSSGESDDEGYNDDGTVVLPWGDGPSRPQKPHIEALEAAGLGGVVPDDHFLVYVVTRRPRLGGCARAAPSAHHTGEYRRLGSEDTTDVIISRIADMTTSSPAPQSRAPSRQPDDHPVEVKYLMAQTKRLEPSPLPPPATYVPPFSSDDEDDDMMDVDESNDGDESSELVQLADANDREELLSRLANPHLSDNTSDDAELSSADEEDEVDLDNGFDYDASNSSDPNLPPGACHAESSAATAGGGVHSDPSGYDSIDEDGDGDVEMA